MREWRVVKEQWTKHRLLIELAMGEDNAVKIAVGTLKDPSIKAVQVQYRDVTEWTPRKTKADRRVNG